VQTTRIFGVEIELACRLTQNRRIVSADKGLSYTEKVAYQKTKIHPHGQFEILPGWKYVYDSSCGAEIVSPPINSTWSIFEMCKRIGESNIKYTLENTGLHVHVQAIDYTPSDVKRIMKFCRHFNRAIYSFMAKRRLKDQYCQPYFVDNEQIKREADDMGWGSDRYRGLNIHAIANHGTIEFRHSEGSTDPKRIAALVDFYIAIVDYCKTDFGFIRSPKGVSKKREYLLDLIGVNEATRIELLKTEF
jgi:putative amidoligase enzyme